MPIASGTASGPSERGSTRMSGRPGTSTNGDGDSGAGDSTVNGSANLTRFAPSPLTGADFLRMERGRVAAVVDPSPAALSGGTVSSTAAEDAGSMVEAGVGCSATGSTTLDRSVTVAAGSVVDCPAADGSVLGCPSAGCPSVDWSVPAGSAGPSWAAASAARFLFKA